MASTRTGPWSVVSTYVITRRYRAAENWCAGLRWGLYDWEIKTFKTIDKNTCAVLNTQPTSSATDWLAAAPGAVLVERIENDGTFVDGYA
jgi:hypothetical protein